MVELKAEETKVTQGAVDAKEISQRMEDELERQDLVAKAVRFREWCESNGVKMPKLEYPAFFEGGLIGVRVREDIQHNEAFLSVPMKV
jgi:hypothetical protein